MSATALFRSTRSMSPSVAGAPDGVRPSTSASSERVVDSSDINAALNLVEMKQSATVASSDSDSTIPAQSLDEHTDAVQRPVGAQKRRAREQKDEGQADAKQRRISAELRVRLEDYFAAEQLPTIARREQIAITLGIPVKKVSQWFCNRRARENRRALTDRETPSSSSPLPAPAPVANPPYFTRPETYQWPGYDYVQTSLPGVYTPPTPADFTPSKFAATSSPSTLPPLQQIFNATMEEPFDLRGTTPQKHRRMLSAACVASPARPSVWMQQQRQPTTPVAKLRAVDGGTADATVTSSTTVSGGNDEVVVAANSILPSEAAVEGAITDEKGEGWMEPDDVSLMLPSSSVGVVTTQSGAGEQVDFADGVEQWMNWKTDSSTLPFGHSALGMGE